MGSDRETRKDRTARTPAKTVLLLLLCGYHSITAHAFSVSGTAFKISATGSQKAAAVCAEPEVTPSSSSGATVRLSHRYGPCSPVPSADEPTIAELLRRDQLRAEYVERKYYGASTGDVKPTELTVPTNLGDTLDTLQYVITVAIGTPAVTQNMMIDTGSDISWVHCTSSNGSVPFEPIKSSTYTPFSCTSTTCTELGDQGNGCSSSQCQYMVMYGDGSNTTGTYGSDTLALTASDTVPSFQFGCSQRADGFDDRTDGLMGLGGDVMSLVSQTAATYGEAFSYCLPNTSSSPGFLTLGATNSTSGFVTTPMFRSKRVPTFYGILLQDIVVGGTPLGISPTVFMNGSIMDSGTIITRLPPRAYSALRSAFRAGMTEYTRAPPFSLFDTCYDFTGLDNISIPAVDLVFNGGAVIDLVFDGIMAEDCLAFAASSRLSLIGNVQQRTFEVLHDVGQSVFGFRSGAC